jgi:carboxyl-terminal processing protease
MKKFFATISCLIALAVTPLAQQSVAPTPLTNPPRDHVVESSEKVRKKTFQKVWEIVRDKFFDPNFNGVDWKKVHEQYAPLVAAAKNDAALYKMLGRMLGELHTSHMEIVTPDEMQKMTVAPQTTGLGLRDVEDKVMVTRVLASSSAQDAGIRPGFVILQIDGTAVKDQDDALTKLAGAANTKVRVTFQGENEKPRDITLERRLLRPDQIEHVTMGKISMYALFESRRLEGGVGYIYFGNFISGLDKKIKAAIDSLHDARGLIIDLRGNGGGDDNVAINLASQLFDRPLQLMISRTRHGDSNYYRTHTVKHPFLGRVAVLVDEASGSASEQLAAGLQELGRAYVIGRKTEGSDMDAEFAKLPTGAYLIYAAGEPRTPGGVVIEGHGVVPNLEVSLTRTELLRGNDAQLSAAVQYIRRR